MRLKPPPAKSAQKGISLIEILIAIVVFSLGLLGLLSAAALTIRTNQDAYVGTQVVNIAEYLVGAMRQNPIGVRQLNYNGTHTANNLLTAIAPTSCMATACSAAALAASDIERTRVLMAQYLPPGATIGVTCVAPTTVPAVSGFVTPTTIPPYNQICTLVETWSMKYSATTETKTWIVQP